VVTRGEVGVLEAPKNANEIKMAFILEALAIMMTLALGSREAAIAKRNDIRSGSSFMTILPNLRQMLLHELLDTEGLFGLL
jgi:hypothetical protein